jgi:hypothetical protein
MYMMSSGLVQLVAVLEILAEDWKPQTAPHPELGSLAGGGQA